MRTFMRIIHTFHEILKLIQIVENRKRRYKISANEKHETNSLFTSPKKTNQHLINVKMVDYLISSSKRIGSNDNNNPTNSQVFKISYQVRNPKKHVSSQYAGQKDEAGTRN